jgi:hypothetical protein
VNKWIVIAWASFIAAGVAEVVFFTVFDPGELYFLGREVELGPLATYSLGFLFFWVFAAASSAFSAFLTTRG